MDTFAPAECNPHAFEWGKISIKAGDWVVDAGACEGFFTRYALERDAKVLMIEPIPRLAEALSYTFDREIRNGRVKLLQGVIGAKNGQTQLNIPQAGPIAASIDPDWNIDENWQKRCSVDTQDINKITVDVFTLDELIAMGIIPRVDFLKMDIENAEVFAIDGAEKLLHSLMPQLSIAVYHDFQNAQLIRSKVLRSQPRYQIWWRGLFIRESFGPPRPYMLYGSV